MKTVINKTRAPLRITLPGGKALHLGPGKSGQIRDEAVEYPAVKKLVKADQIEIREDRERDSRITGGTASPHKVSQVQGRSTFKQKTGDR